MRHSILVVLTLSVLVFNACIQSEPNCQSIRDGNFSIIYMDGSKGFVNRQGNMQEEISKERGTRSKYAVVWLDDCSYLLYDRAVTQGEDMYAEFNNDTLEVKIIGLCDDGFIIKSRFRVRNSDWFEEKMYFE